MRFSCIVFDIDGTLIDSSPDVAAALNSVLVSRGRSPLAVDRVRALWQDQLRSLLRAAFRSTGESLSDPAINEALADFRAAWTSRIGSDALLADDAPLHLRRLVDGGARLCVLTNRSEHVTVSLLERFGLADYFEFVLPGGHDSARKPDPAGLSELMTHCGVSDAETLLVGATQLDLKTARHGGVKCAMLASFRPRAELVAMGADYTLSDLASLVPLALGSESTGQFRLPPRP